MQQYYVKVLKGVFGRRENIFQEKLKFHFPLFGFKKSENILQRKIVFSLMTENPIIILGKLIFQIHCTHAARPLLPPLCSLSASPSLDTHLLLPPSILSLPLFLFLDSWRLLSSKTLAITRMCQLCSIAICFLISTFVNNLCYNLDVRV